MAQLIIQPSNADARIVSGHPNTNYGTEPDTWIGQDGAGNVNRAVLSLDFSVLLHYTITAVLLELNFGTYDSGRTLWVYRLTRPTWTEDGVTWNKYDGTNSWTSAGGDWTVTDAISAASASGWVQWNVLNQVLYAQANTSGIVHFLIKDSTETANHLNNFYSREYATNLTLRPKLTLTYTPHSPIHLFSQGMM
jgi:hypothetical protein